MFKISTFSFFGLLYSTLLKKKKKIIIDLDSDYFIWKCSFL